MPFEAFYTAASQLFFTLLGFWWVVVQFKYEKWVHNPDRRRMAYVVSLHFLLPGLMCVVSLLSATTPFVWNIAFIVAGVSGVVASVLTVSDSNGKSETGVMRSISLSHIVAIVLYSIIVLAALFAGFLSSIGITPLAVEAITLSILAFLGINLAWFLFMQPSQ